MTDIIARYLITTIIGVKNLSKQERSFVFLYGLISAENVFSHFYSLDGAAAISHINS